MKKMIIVEEESTKNNLVKNKFVNFIISLVCYLKIFTLIINIMDYMQ